MKLSKSKLALAKVINDNGGWKDARFAAQEKCGVVYFYFNEPNRGGLYWHGSASPVTGIEAAANSNWYRCFISREEYYHAYPKADADGWIEWNADGKSDGPIGHDVHVDVKLRCGSEHLGQLLSSDSWMDLWGDESIVAYRLHKPEVKPEFCESVMRSIPEPKPFKCAYDPKLISLANVRIVDEGIPCPSDDNAATRLSNAVELVKAAAPHLLSDKYKFNGDEVMGERKPTIEQLAQDYRNKIDCANRKLKEAEDASVSASSALSLLRDECKKLGLNVSPSLDMLNE